MCAQKAVDRSEIDALVVVTQNPDRNIPHVSAIVHGALGLPTQCACFDISPGCSGFVYALSVFQDFMEANGMKKGLLFTADPYSMVVGPNDNNTSLLFGDAASVTLVSDSPRLVSGMVTFGTLGAAPLSSIRSRCRPWLKTMVDKRVVPHYGSCTKEMIMTALPRQLSECTVFLLAKAYQRTHGEFKKLLKPYGLTNIQHIVLESLRHEPGATAAELGKLLILDKATLSGVIDRLGESVWIVKKSDSEDSRVQRLYLTDKAEETMEGLIEKRDKFDEDLLADFSIEERILLKRLLKELI